MDHHNGSPQAMLEFESWEEAKQLVQTELAGARAEHRDLHTKIERGRMDVEKLVSRNRTTTVNLQRVQANLEMANREEIRAAYDQAIDTLQRLFVMRGQVEKMEAEEAALSRYMRLLESTERIMEMGMSNQPGSAGSFATVEMMIRAQESERQRLSRQMHDGPAQALANFILQAEIATRFFDVDSAKAREELQILKDAASETFQQVRDFIFHLRPMMLDDLGAIPTVRRYVDAVKHQTGAEIDVVVTGTERRLESYLEVIIFRSVQELLSHAVEQNHATEVQVQIDLSEHEVRVSLEDNGKGFDPSVFEGEEYMGVKIIKERAELLGGYFEIDSAAEQGARVTFRIPVSTLTESS